jgi:hypothetical protein
VSRPLQNRVTPFGDLIATPARGTLMGNRGRLHDLGRRIVRRVAGGSRPWVTCRLEFNGRHRTVMSPGRYTELFFLDEATALAAGHRPCGECRHGDYQRFRTAWLRGNPDRGLAAESLIGAIDRELHRDRLGADGRPRTYQAELRSLPDGVFIVGPSGAESFLVWRGSLHPWSAARYGQPRPPGRDERVLVLTPRSTVGAIAAGYVPTVHPSIGVACARRAVRPTDGPRGTRPRQPRAAR